MSGVKITEDKTDRTYYINPKEFMKRFPELKGKLNYISFDWDSPQGIYTTTVEK